MRSSRTRVLAVLTLVLSLLMADLTGVATPAAAGGGGTVDLTGAVPATFTITPGVEQLTVRGATPRSPLTLVDATLERVVTLYTDTLGQLVFQYVPKDFLVFDAVTQGVLPTIEGATVAPGIYRVVSEGVPGQPFAGTLEASAPFQVLAVGDLPDPALYSSQTLPFTSNGGGAVDLDGYGYLTTRDGTSLSVNVRLPDPAIYGPGPYPTVVQYSGYAPARPGLPEGADAGGLLAGILGFAYVGVNLRGSGCSGGVFDAFNAAQAADGYDVIETVARQPWVKHGKVGMMGISFSGITQLFVGSTQPPSLAAITPMSVIEDPWYQQWPGGMYNAGFTQQWLAQRDDESAGGAQWVKDRVSGGDATCISNLEMRSQAIPFEAFARSLIRRPAAADDRNLSLTVRNINVPVYLSGAWQDEQTGSRFGLMLDDFTGVPGAQRKFMLYNGHHPDGLSPLVLTRWFEFLSFYVDQTVPRVNPAIRPFAPVAFETFFGVVGNGFEPDRFIGPDGTTPIHGNYAGALAAYEAEQPVRVLFEVGANPNFASQPGAHRERFEMSFPSWPVPDTVATSFGFGELGSLSSGLALPAGGTPVPVGTDRFSFDSGVLGTRYFKNGDHGNRIVNNEWKRTADGKGLAYITPPLTEDVVVAGEGHVDLWIRSTGTDAPIEVVLSEVYAEPDPNGQQELRVQNGMLRAGFRTIDPSRSEGTRVDHRFEAPHYQPLVPGTFVNVKVPLFSVAHGFRSGSRIRLEVNTPGGDSALWDFESENYGATTHDIAWGGNKQSALVLPVLPASTGHVIPAPFAPQSARPVCDSLRGQPCRAYTPMVNETLPPEIDDFVPVVPERLLDTRDAQLGYTGPKPIAEQTIEFDVTGVGTTAVPNDAEAVVINVTGTQPTDDGFITIYPCGTPRPTTSNLNLPKDGTTANLVITKIGTDGNICLYTKSGAHLIADITGWYPAGSSYTPVTPERLLDTRDAQLGYTGPKPIAEQTIEFDVTGVGTTAVPNDAEAVVINVTGTQPTDDGFITIYPCGTPRPTTANLNHPKDGTTANLVITKIGTDGKICLYTKSGAHLIADITGWYPAG